MRRRAALALASIGALAPSARALAQGARDRIRCAGPITEDITNVYYAIKNGLFARAGLDVELVAANSGTAAVAAAVAGTYELARTSLLPLFAAHLRDIPLLVVAPGVLFAGTPLSLLQVAADSADRTGTDLDGKTLGTPALNDLNTLAARAWVDKNGGDWRSLRFVEVPNAAMEAALAQHRIEAAVLQPPQLDASLAAGTTKTIGNSLSAIAPAFMYGAYVARSDWSAQHADELRRFNRVLTEATLYVGAHLAETVPLVVELTKIDVASSAHLHRAVNATSLDPSLVQPLIDAAARYGQIPRAFPAREILFSAR